MKTTLIRIDRSEKDTYYIGIGIGYETERNYGWFAGIIIAFFIWDVRIGIDREYLK